MKFFSLTLISMYAWTVLAVPMKREMPHFYGDHGSYDEAPATEVFAGIGTFGHLTYERCLSDPSIQYDIAVVGIPFDTTTTYRPGARFGPAAIREGSRRTIVTGTYNVPFGFDPYSSGLNLVDCGDIPVTPYDNDVAVGQMYKGYLSLLERNSTSGGHNATGSSKISSPFPRILTLGGDHTIVLPILRALHTYHGRPVSVIHFDSHMDSWKPFSYKGHGPNLNHGTYFYFAAKEGLMSKNQNIHVGIRSKVFTPHDYKDDHKLGFQLIEANEIDEIGTKGIIDRIKKVVGDNYVYLSLDIDVLDPSYAPATGTPETGGFSTRELRKIIRGLEGLKFVGADVVEVSPAYDNAQLTSMAAADVMYDIMTMMTKHKVY
ncbi:arginase family protein [Halteromyces radiatus]|uniref:arginase family protein n=1 Tax=Halteromyces radiatus TaxID=101107 RepID=UPI00221ECC38|nr:arginase family protein [Halteromyces radiatus]KAI8099164.1 arginase family protein [Halteromyces radiatus]